MEIELTVALRFAVRDGLSATELADDLVAAAKFADTESADVFFLGGTITRMDGKAGQMPWKKAEPEIIDEMII